MTPAIPVVPLSAVSDVTAAQAPGAAFEQIANEARSRALDATSPPQLGSAMLDNLSGYIERAGRFSAPGAATAASASVAPPGGSAPGPGMTSSQIDRVIASLSTVFNYSIETQLVVRGGTQISGAANTLLRGQ